MKKMLTICVALILIVSGSVLAYVTTSTHGSVWLLRTLLKHRFGVPLVSIGGSSGNILTGLKLEDVKVDAFDYRQFQGGIAVKELHLQFAEDKWKFSVEAEADTISIHVENIFESLTAGELQYKGSQLQVQDLSIKNLSKITGDNSISAESLSLQFPLTDNQSIQTKNISVESVMGRADIGRARGSLLKLIAEEIEIASIPHIHAEGLIQIQKAVISSPFHWINITSLENGRLKLIESDTVLFYGTQSENLFNINLYSKTVELEPLLAIIRPLKGVSASVGDADIVITGNTEEAVIEGKMIIQHLMYRRFYMANDPELTLDLKIHKEEGKIRLNGDATLSGGEIVHKKIRLQLEPGKITFRGNPEIPSFDLKASAKISKTQIKIHLKGTPDTPDISLSSIPPYPEEKILIMLITGKEWSGTEQSIREGKISTDAAREFVDYFIFGGKGEKLAKRFGIKEISLHTDENTKGFDVKKAVTQKVDVGYGLEQKNPQSIDGTIAQKVAIDYNVSDNTKVSVEGTVEAKSEKSDSLSNQDSANDTSVTLKLKRSF